MRAIRANNISWNTSDDILPIAKLRGLGAVAWYSASGPKNVSTPGSAVGSVTDLLGISPALTQSTAANKPLLTRGDNLENRCPSSNDLTGTGWAIVEAVVTGANSFLELATTATHRCRNVQLLELANGGTTILEAEFKSIGGRNAGIGADGGGTAFIDLADGSIYGGKSIPGTTSVNMGGGWWKITTGAFAATGIRCVLYSIIDGATTFFLGDITKGVEVRNIHAYKSGLSTTNIVTTTTPQYAGMSPRGQLENRLVSSLLSNATYWTNDYETLNASIADPFGGTGAFEVLGTSDDQRHQIYTAAANRPANVSGETLSLRVCYKNKDNTQKAWIGWAPGSYDGAVIGTDGSIVNVSKCTAVSTPIGNGWFLIDVTYPTYGTPTGFAIGHTNSSTASNGPASYVHDGTGFYVYGPVIASSLASKTYQPTTTAPVIGVGVATPALWFDGVNDGLASATFAATMAQPQTIIAVAQRNRAFTTNNLLVGDSAGVNCIIYGDNGSSNLTAFGGANLHVAAINYNPFVVSAVFNGASSSTFLNGAAGGAGNIGTTSATNRILIAGSTDSERWSGIIESVILFNTALSAANRQWVERFLGARCGIKVA